MNNTCGTGRHQSTPHGLSAVSLRMKYEALWVTTTSESPARRGRCAVTTSARRPLCSGPPSGRRARRPVMCRRRDPRQRRHTHGPGAGHLCWLIGLPRPLRLGLIASPPRGPRRVPQLCAKCVPSSSRSAVQSPSADAHTHSGRGNTKEPARMTAFSKPRKRLRGSRPDSRARWRRQYLTAAPRRDPSSSPRSPTTCGRKACCGRRLTPAAGCLRPLCDPPSFVPPERAVQLHRSSSDARAGPGAYKSWPWRGGCGQATATGPGRSCTWSAAMTRTGSAVEARPSVAPRSPRLAHLGGSTRPEDRRRPAGALSCRLAQRDYGAYSVDGSVPYFVQTVVTESWVSCRPDATMSARSRKYCTY